MTIFMGEGITRTSDPDAIMYDLILNFKEMMPLRISLLATSKKGAAMGNSTSTPLPPSYEGRQLQVINIAGGESRFIRPGIWEYLEIYFSRSATSCLADDKKGISAVQTIKVGQFTAVARKPRFSNFLVGRKSKNTKQHTPASRRQVPKSRIKKKITDAVRRRGKALPYCPHGQYGYQALSSPVDLAAVLEPR
jgi:hypothetical protein